MNKEYICTVLLISFNHKSYIELAIESALQQKTSYNYKIHIFDDCSTDGTVDIIKRYAEKYPDKIIPFIADKNAGAQQNIWNAYKSVDTKYCAQLECDDCWCDEEKLQLQIDIMEKNPDCSFCAHNTLAINIDDPFRHRENNGIFVFNRNVRKTGKYAPDDFKMLYGAGWAHHNNSRLIRMSCVELDALENKEDFLYDNCQFFYLFCKGNLFFIQRVMSVYHMNASSSFTSLTAQKKIISHFDKLMCVNKNTNGEFERLIFRHLGSFSRYWFGLDDLRQGIIKDVSDLRHLISRYLKSLLLDSWLHVKLRRHGKKGLKMLKNNIDGR